MVEHLVRDVAHDDAALAVAQPRIGPDGKLTPKRCPALPHCRDSEPLHYPWPSAALGEGDLFDGVKRFH